MSEARPLDPGDRPWLQGGGRCDECGVELTDMRTFAFGSADRDEVTLCEACAVVAAPEAVSALLRSIQRAHAEETIRPRKRRTRPH